MFIPWITPQEIIEDSEGDQDIFHNFTLGLPFVSKDTSVSRKTILNCLVPGYNPRTDVAIGVDNGVKKHYVLGNKYGIFEIGITEDWEEIESLRNQYNATMVIDANPYPNMPTRLANKYAGKVYLHYYQQDRKTEGTLRWDTRSVKSDRTKIIDYVVAELNSKDISFNLTEHDLEEYISHWSKIYRVIKETNIGTRKPEWETIENKADHFAHATVYWRIALEQTLGQGGVVRAPRPGRHLGRNPEVGSGGTVPALNLKEIAERTIKRRRV